MTTDPFIEIRKQKSENREYKKEEKKRKKGKRALPNSHVILHALYLTCHPQFIHGNGTAECAWVWGEACQKTTVTSAHCSFVCSYMFIHKVDMQVLLNIAPVSVRRVGWAPKVSLFLRGTKKGRKINTKAAHGRLLLLTKKGNIGHKVVVGTQTESSAIHHQGLQTLKNTHGAVSFAHRVFWGVCLDLFCLIGIVIGEAGHPQAAQTTGGLAESSFGFTRRRSPAHTIDVAYHSLRHCQTRVAEKERRKRKKKCRCRLECK
ncbi:hypothetical protein BDF14DRAFT_1867268 [Spinellus fusiger]|nr:hypothetical protein BDF14DRAFT_1867268 [Spinellus fusiger]